MLRGSFFYGSRSGRPRQRANRAHAGRRPRFEALEDRRLLSFTPAVNYPVGANPHEVVTGDFNGDGHLDLATLNLVDEIQWSRGTVSVLPGDGAGGFGAAINSDVGANLYTNGDPYLAWLSLTVADFDNDGDLDLAMAITFQNTETGEFGGAARVSLGNGDGTFGAATDIPALDAVDSVASGDFNNDGNSDLVVTGYSNPFGEYYGYAQVLLGNGQGGFASPPYLTWFDSNYYELAVGDLNGDGKLDAVGTAGQYGGWGIALLGNGGASGAFSDSYGFYTPGTSAGVAVGDFTGDGKLDVITAGRTVDLHRGHGDGSFDAVISHTANGNAHTGVAAADFNGDGKLDAVTSDSDQGTVSALRGNGDGTLMYAAAFAVGSSTSAVAVGDFNGDGRTDVAAASSGTANVSVLLNDGNWSGETILTGDYNRDSTVDAADYVVWRKMQGTMVTPSTGADGDGDGMVDQDDYGVWRSRFGQMASPPAAGSGVNVAGEIEAQATEAIGVRVQTNLGTSQVGKTKSAVEMRRASEKQPAMMVRDSAFVELLDRPPASLAQIRLAVRSPLGARAAHEASRRDDAVLMWVSPDSKQAVNDWQSGKMLEDKEANNAGDAFFESIDEVFSLLASG